MSEIIVGIVQDEYTADPRVNTEKTISLLEKEYNVADIVVLPEYSMINILKVRPEKAYELSEYIEDSNYLSKLSDLAGRIDAYILTHFIERTDNPPKTMSSSVLVYPSGKFVRVYSKIHLFDAYGYRESDYFIPGKKLSSTLLIRNMKFKVAICYDLRFPELFRKYAWEGVDGVIVQAGWVKGPLKEEILNVLAKARSHENTYYIILANQTGELFTGRSGVFNPHGYRELDMGYYVRYNEWIIKSGEVAKAAEKVPTRKQSREIWDIRFERK